MELLISILTSTLWFLLAITILVFVHELGHFLTAKYFGMRVERFSIGFPPTILGRRYGETEYAVGGLPLGGYVKISGMIDESLDTEHVDEEPDPWEFRAKPVWQRIVVISAGVVFNALLAVLIFGGLRWSGGETYIPAENVPYVYVDSGSVAYEVGLRSGDRIVEVNGEPFTRFEQMNPSALVAADTLTVTVVRDSQRTTMVGPSNLISRLSRARNRDQGFGLRLPPIIQGVKERSSADSIGLRAGDRIQAIAGDSVRSWGQISTLIQETNGEPVTIRWFRADSLVTASSQPSSARRVKETPHGLVFESQGAASYNADFDQYLLGVRGPGQTQNYGLGQALTAGAVDTWEYTRNIVVTLKRIITGRDSLTDSLGGPVMIAKVTSQAAAAGPGAFWQLVGALSITLAIMNFLPIPALDGGQFLFLLYEGVTRRRPSVRVRLIAQQVGMILLLGFMAFLIFNDILRL